jgi:hypothetical protein
LDNPDATADGLAAATAYGITALTAEVATAAVTGVVLSAVGVTLPPVIAGAIAGFVVFTAVKLALTPIFEGTESFAADELSSIDWNAATQSALDTMTAALSAAFPAASAADLDTIGSVVTDQMSTFGAEIDTLIQNGGSADTDTLLSAGSQLTQALGLSQNPFDALAQSYLDLKSLIGLGNGGVSGSPVAPFSKQHPAPPNPRDPLVLDLAGTGLQFTALSNSSPAFDFTGSGFATQTGWITPGEGLLLLDNGRGDTAVTADELLGAASGDGFADLAALDANGDGLVDARDPAFANLKVWVDANGNGKLDAGELYTLGDLGITAISVAAAPSEQNINGNTVVGTSTVSQTAADGSTVTRSISEVDFATSTIQTTYTPPQGFTYSDEALNLPQLIGYGNVPNLWVAMSLDSTLLANVKNLVLNAGTMSSSDFDQAFQAIVQEWAGASGVDPTSRGSSIDARHLAVDYAFYGLDQTTSPVYQIDPNGHSGPQWEAIYQSIVDELEVRFISQLGVSEQVNGISAGTVADSWIEPFSEIEFNPTNDTVGVNLTQLIGSIMEGAPADPTPAISYYGQMLPVVEKLCVDLAGEDSQQLVMAIVAASLISSASQSARETLWTNLGLTWTNEGTSVGPIQISAQNAVVFLGTGDKVLNGGANDAYVYSSAGGDDAINGGGSASGLIFQDVASTGVTLSRSGDSQQDLTILVGDTGKTVTVMGEFNSGAMDSIGFADGVSWGQAQIAKLAHITMLGRILERQWSIRTMGSTRLHSTSLPKAMSNSCSPAMTSS